MTDSNNKSFERIINHIIKFLNKNGLGTGFVLLILGIVLGIYDSHFILRILSILFSTFGSTILSVFIINLMYQQWQDQNLQNRLTNIPSEVQAGINKSIETISKNVVREITPGVPYRIFHKGYNDGEFETSLKISIDNSDGKYYYTGIGMSTMAHIIAEIHPKLKEIFFIIPNPTKVRCLEKEDKKIMKDSISQIIRVWKKDKTIKLVFVLLNYIPPFHIHRTSEDCWFAFVDKNNVKNGNNNLNRYPVTYQYKRKINQNRDIREMYYTIDETINKLYERHKEIESYIFKENQILGNRNIYIKRTTNGANQNVTDNDAFIIYIGKDLYHEIINDNNEN